ncbi:MAG: CPBP family intramembrane metalloprotease [Candidatus Bathyarchaeota archaeon]|nr:CPBP family intramembrane metalloprotease [Candidatus Bathyarchaeota archaeon]
MPRTLAESSIMMLNLVLPLWIVLKSGGGLEALRDRIAWRRYGIRTYGWAVVGLLLGFVAVPYGVSWLFGPSFPYGEGVALRLPEDWPVLLLMVFLILVSTLGEEVMFRGYIQTGLEEVYGPMRGVLIPVALFSLRHLPADLYWGQGASIFQWASRLVQIWSLAFVFGLVRLRSRSTVSTWVMHLLGYLTVIITNALNMV